MPFFKKRPVLIEAKQFTLDIASNEQEWFALADWCNGKPRGTKLHDPSQRDIEIPTLEGSMAASVGDWIIKGVKGEFYPCKPDIFEKTHEPEFQRYSGMNFGDALRILRMGGRVARCGWNGRGIFIELQTPDEHSKMTSPYIFIDTTGLQTDNPHAPKSRVPWLASQTDMLAEDWVDVTASSR